MLSVVPHDLLTTTEVAAALRVTRATVTAWVRDGQLPALTLPGGRGYRIRRSDVEAFLVPAEHTPEVTP